MPDRLEGSAATRRPFPADSVERRGNPENPVGAGLLDSPFHNRVYRGASGRPPPTVDDEHGNELGGPNGVSTLAGLTVSNRPRGHPPLNWLGNGWLFWQLLIQFANTDFHRRELALLVPAVGTSKMKMLGEFVPAMEFCPIPFRIGFSKTAACAAGRSRAPSLRWLTEAVS